MNDRNWQAGDPIESPVGEMLGLDPDTMSRKDLYKLLIGTIVPRPIAFVSTKSKAGVSNVAPFSFFSGVSSKPPCLMFSCGISPTVGKKHTLINIEETSEFVVNSSNEWMIDAVVHSAAEYPEGVSEFEKVGLTAVDSKIVRVPRVKEAAVQIECKLERLVEIGDGTPGSAVIVVGRIVYAHIDENCYENGRVNFANYKTIGRMGGIGYGKIGETFEIPVPKV